MSGGYDGWSAWIPSPNTNSSSASPDLNFSPPPNTQSSGFYRPYPVDMQNAPEGQYGWSSDHGSTDPIRLSQISCGVNAGGGGGGGDGDGDGGNPHVSTPYTPREMEKLFETYVAVSEDPSVGTNQTGATFWGRIMAIYNANRPEGTVPRNESMLRNAWRRADGEIKKFQGFYLEEGRAAGSGSSDVDVIAAASSAYHTMLHKPFKHISTWKKVKHLPRWANGTESSSEGSSKRSRSQSNLGEDEVASQLAGAHLTSTDTDAGPSRRRRPTGQKTSRRNGRAAQAPPPPQFVPPPPPAPIPPNPNTLFPILQAALAADVTRMSPEQREANNRMIYALQVQLGVMPPPPSN